MNSTATQLDIKKLDDPNNAYLASKIIIDELHKIMKQTLVESMEHHYTDAELNLIREWEFIKIHNETLYSMLNFERDYLFDYTSFIKVQNKYLLHKLESPQHMFLRVAIATSLRDMNNVSLKLIKEKYDGLSMHYYIHGTPSMLNSCTPISQLASCFLLRSEDDITEIMDTLSDCANISKNGGGIGLSYQNIRCKGQLINSTKGTSSGITPQIKLHNDNMLCWNQGGRRDGAMTVYLEPWHGDIIEFLELKKNVGDDNKRARHLHYAIWMNNLFMKRLETNTLWSLFSPNTAPGLDYVYDNMLVYENGYLNEEMIDMIEHMIPFWAKLDLPPYFHSIMTCIDKSPVGEPVIHDIFTDLYSAYEKAKLYTNQINPTKIASMIAELKRDTGNPYILFKDTINAASNHKNIGTIKCSNLCTEIMQYSSSRKYATCTLASINIKKFYDKKTKQYDFNKLAHVTKLVTDSLDTTIDINKYPTHKATQFSKDVRAIGIGIQGLADLLCKARIPYISEEAKQLEQQIMKTIYYAALDKSCELAQIYGPYHYYNNSDISKLLINNTNLECDEDLKQRINKYGVRNSLLTTIMPTASTSAILNNNESYEPYMANIYTSENNNGKDVRYNKYMINHLLQLGLWNENIKNQVIINDGSIQNIESIPDDVKAIYKTVWEIKQKDILEKLANIRNYIDQGISLNLYFATVDDSTTLAAMFYAHKLGLKNGNYYIRSKPSVSTARNISITTIEETYENLTCSRDSGCDSCSG